MSSRRGEAGYRVGRWLRILQTSDHKSFPGMGNFSYIWPHILPGGGEFYSNFFWKMSNPRPMPASPRRLDIDRCITVASFKYNSVVGHLAFSSASFVGAPSFIISLELQGKFSWITMWPDSSGLAIFTSLYALIKRVKLSTEKRTLKASFFFSKATRAKVKA